jgi:hypothetical protein
MISSSLYRDLENPIWAGRAEPALRRIAGPFAALYAAFTP